MEAFKRCEDFLTELRLRRDAWERLLAEAPPAWWEEPGVAGDWSLKDVAAHVTWYERETILILRRRALIGSRLWRLPLDQRNAAIWAECRAVSLEEARAAAEQVFAELLQSVAAFNDEELNQENLIPGLPPGWNVWKIVSSNSCDHYDQHIPSVRAWLMEKNR